MYTPLLLLYHVFDKYDKDITSKYIHMTPTPKMKGITLNESVECK